MKAIYLVHQRGISERMIKEIGSISGIELELEHKWEGMSPEVLANRIRECEILLLSRAPELPDSLLADAPGNLKYVCFLHGSVKKVGEKIIKSPDITVTNWGDHPARGLANGSLVLLFACLLDVHKRIMAVRRGQGKGIDSVGGTVKGLRVGLYGCGFAGKALVDLLLPLGAEIKIFDPYIAEVPPRCSRVDSLDKMFENIQALVVFAGLTEETRHSITAERLAMLPDHGVVINMARGAIIDQEALFAELKSGRLRAGLDVLEPDDLPEDHEARQWENLIWTCHHLGAKNWPGEEALCRRDEVVLENLRAYVEGKPLKYVIDEARYNLMT